MNDDNVIAVDNITKSFKVYTDNRKTLKDCLSLGRKKNYKKREILNGISFCVKKGEAVGLIGRNGCGKSTTLKMLAKIIYPDSGSVVITGKVSSLLELGAGFHPDMSGMENIYLNASIFGLTRKEIDQKIDDIITFSELEEFIDNPVRTYSSGMYMRLAFAVAINVNADILLIDEILGVGDVNFQKKCFEKLKEIKMSGTTIIIVSHSLEQIEQICDRSIWVSEGKIKEEGKPKIINEHYYKAMEDKRLNKKESEILNISNHTDNKERKKKEQEKLPVFCDKMAIRTGNMKSEIVDIKLLNEKGEEKVIFNQGNSLRMVCKVKSSMEDIRISVSASIWRDDGILCYGVNSYIEKEILITIDKCSQIELIFPELKLMGGKYWMNVSLYSEEMEQYDSIKCAKQFYIEIPDKERESGICKMDHFWRCKDSII